MPALKRPEAAAGHERIALQFSGGKDSTVVLLLLRDLWPRLTVYWLNSGDAFPETAAFVRGHGAAVVEAGGRFVEVPGRVDDVIATFGPPADIIGADASEPAHTLLVGRGERLQDRALCCLRSKMAPLQQRMIDDGITLIVRGQKAADDFKGPFRDGDSADGFAFWFPIEDWSDSDVLAWLVASDAVPPLYAAGLLRSGDCMRCSAWLGDRRAEYLVRHHPVAFRDYAERVFSACRAAEGAVGRTFGEAKAIHAATAHLRSTA